MTNKLKNKRGFSLVELMVVVAIMGTLASIAIPAFNEYRRSAKKAGYRADLSSLHKGWLAFGVEIDSFCDRDTIPQDASLESVGMASLRTSKLYGTRDAIAGCEVNGTLDLSIDENACNAGSNNWNLNAIPASNTNGPGKHNFIGFGTNNCANISNDRSIQEVGAEGSTPTNADALCDLGVDSYEMGVYGHVSGQNYFGVSINNNGVLSSQNEKDTGQNSAVSNCTT